MRFPSSSSRNQLAATLKSSVQNSLGSTGNQCSAPGQETAALTLAQEVLAACERFETELFAILAKVRSDEPAAERQKFQRSVGHVAADLGERLLYPIYRNHPLLVPEQLRGELL